MLKSTFMQKIREICKLDYYDDEYIQIAEIIKNNDIIGFNRVVVDKQDLISFNQITEELIKRIKTCKERYMYEVSSNLEIDKQELIKHINTLRNSYIIDLSKF